MIRTLWLAAAMALALACTPGCAGWDGVLPVTFEPPPDPEAGPSVRIVAVHDLREFRRIVHDPSWPSLYRSLPLEPAWTERALGRRRGKRGGNLLAPEDRTAGDLVSEALVVAFREQGVRVADGEEEGALPVEIEILELWSWLQNRRLGPPSFRFRGRLRVTAPKRPYYPGAEVRADRVFAAGGASQALWTRVVREGLLSLARRVVEPWAARPSAP